LAARNPFGGPGYEFHSGQDIEARGGARGCRGERPSSFVGWQNGYGQLVIVDHGGGLTTRYGHLSHIDVELNQMVSRGNCWKSRIDRPFDWTTPALRSANQRSSRESVAVSAADEQPQAS
jgi:hypothetical protein